MFWQRFYDLCISISSKPNPVGKKIGISSATITQWKQGAIPTGDTLAKIADFFDCSVDYLLGRTDNLSIEAEGDLQRIIDIYKNLNMEGRKQLLIQADILSRADEYKKCSDSEQVG